MKKLLLFFAPLLAILPAAAETQTATLIFQDLWGSQRGPQTITTSYATVTFNKNDATTAIAYNTNSDGLVRLYKPSTTGGKGAGITVKKSDSIEKIVSVTLTKKDGTTAAFELNEDGSFEFANTTNGRIDVKGLTIVYDIPDGPVDFKYPYETYKTFVFGTDEEYTIPMPDVCPANIKWTSSDTEEAVIMLDGPFLMVAGVGTAVVTAIWEANEAFNAGSFEYTINVVAPPAAGTPVVTINGKALEANAFYNVTEGAVATITSENAKEIYVYNENFADIKTLEGASCELPIEFDGEYYINASNGIDENKGISINFKLLEPGEPVVPISYVWRKVTAVEDVTLDGEYVIAAKGESATGKAYSSILANENKSNNRGAADVDIAENEIKELPSAAMIFTLSFADGAYNWYTENYLDGDKKPSKGFLGAVASKNQLNMLQSIGNGTQTSIAFDNENVKINFINCANKGKDRYLGFNFVNDPQIFNAYASDISDTNCPIQLYKKTEVKGEPEIVISLSEYLPKIGETEHLAFANDEVAKKMTFISLIPGVKFHHCTEKIAAPNRMMHRAPAAATWAELENGEYDHSDNANGTHIWVKAVKESPVNEATIESPEFWQFILPEGITTGIDSVAAEESGEVELYNLQGVRVDRRSAAPGLYIERRGGKVAKVVL